jgi:hypothetical protein
MTLLDHHAELLKASAISPEVADARGYWSATMPRELDRHFGQTQRRLVPALVIPTYDVRGEVVFHQLRPDEPRTVDGRVRKYEIPPRARMAIDVPPAVRTVLGNPKVPLGISEGARKADSAVTAGLYTVDFVGVWTWRGRNSDGGLTALSDWEYIALNDRVVYLIFDSDAMVKHEVHDALTRLTAFLRYRDADVRIVYLPHGEHGEKVGLDDFLAAGHTRDDVLRLAVDQLRPLPGGRASQPQPPKVPAPTGGDLIDAIVRFTKRFIVWPSDHAALAVTLWIIHTWAFEAAAATPYMLVVSPERRSGKSRALEVCEVLVRRARIASSISAAALYQLIEKEKPTMLIDEIDSIFGAWKGDESIQALRGIINAGNRPGFPVTRGTREGEAVDYDVYSPKMLAGINDGTLPDTIADRSIPIRMQRKRRGEKVERWRPRRIAVDAEALRDQCHAFAAKHQATLAAYEVDPAAIGDKLDDRAEDGWEPLLAIAKVAGREQDALEAAIALSADRVVSRENRAHDLFIAVHQLLSGDQAEDGQMHTKTLIAKLNDDDDASFKDWHKGKGPSQYDFRTMLGDRYGVRSKNITVDGKQRKGYALDGFTDAWDRYGDLIDDQQSATDGTNHPSDPSDASASDEDWTDRTDRTDARPPSEDASWWGQIDDVDSAGPDRTPAFCRNPAHRDSDWAFPTGETWVCGVCHPPVAADVVYRNGRAPTGAVLGLPGKAGK